MVKTLVDELTDVGDQVIHVSTSFSVWWEISNAQNERKYGPIVRKYGHFFSTIADSLLSSFVVGLHTLWDGRRDVTSLKNLAKRIGEEMPALQRETESVLEHFEQKKDMWAKIVLLRSNVYAHRSGKLSAEEVFEKAGMSPNEFRELVDDMKKYTKYMAKCLGYHDWTVVEVDAVPHTKRVMKLLIEGSS